MRVQITRLDPSVSLPAYSTPGSAGFDLAAAHDLEVPPHQIRLVGTGLVMKVPDGYFMAIIARSSTPLKRGLIVPNGVGVVDSDYCGTRDEVRVQVMNMTDAPVTVRKGDRIAQGILLPAERIEWEETERAADQSRGGFGSTG